MLKFRQLLAVLALSLASLAGAADLVAGKDYTLINPPQPTEKAKVEVIEFFSYMCPHCDHLDPLVGKWQKTLARDVVFTRVPVIFRPQWEAPAKLFYTLEALGEFDKLHAAAFAAIHRENTDLSTDQGVAAWAAKKGLDPKKFADAYGSFSVQSGAQRSKQRQGAYGIPGVPAFVVAGKYRTPDDFHGNFDELLALVDKLIVKARTEQGRK